MELRIAIATSDRQTVDLHFGRCPAFAIVRLDTETGAWAFEADRPVPPREGDAPCGHDPAYFGAVAAMLSDCSYLMVQKIGPQPARAMERAGIAVLEISMPVRQAVDQLCVYVRKAQNK